MLVFNWKNEQTYSVIKHFYRQFLPYSRPSKKEKIGYLQMDQAIIASVRLRPIGQYTLLTGMLVSPANRGQGIAHELMIKVIPYLTPSHTFLFSLPHLTKFYEKYNFIKATQVPNDIELLYKRYKEQGKNLVVMQL